MRPTPISAKVCQSGMSLVELMVGMLVGLIGIIIISQMYITNEQYKRSTTGAGSAQVNGAIALYTLERDIRMAGYGINHPDAMGCTCDAAAKPGCSPLQYYFNGGYSFPPGPSAAGAKQALRVAPVMIEQDPFPNQPDIITILSGNDNERATPVRLTQTMAAATQNFVTAGTAGFSAAEPHLVIVTDLGATCALAQVTSAPAGGGGGAGVAGLLYRAVGGFNPANNGDLPLFSRDAAIFSLGTAPIWRAYFINRNSLSVTDVLAALAADPAATQDLVDDIIDMRAEYGIDLDDDPNRTVDVFRIVPPPTPAEWQRTYAIRIAMLARSKNYEKGDPPGTCQATTAANQPTWGTAKQPFPVLAAALAGGGDAGCYRYRAFETVVPLRNMIWR